MANSYPGEMPNYANQDVGVDIRLELLEQIPPGLRVIQQSAHQKSITRRRSYYWSGKPCNR